MIEVEASRIIERPIEAVWAYMSNLDNMLAWDPGLVEVKWHPPLAPGDALELHDASPLLRLVERIGGRSKATFHVTDYEEGRQFGLRVSPSPTSWLQAAYSPRSEGSRRDEGDAGRKRERRRWVAPGRSPVKGESEPRARSRGHQPDADP